jgi:hypothetical protein
MGTNARRRQEIGGPCHLRIILRHRQQLRLQKQPDQYDHRYRNSTALAGRMFGGAFAIGNADVEQTLSGAAFTFVRTLGNPLSGSSLLGATRPHRFTVGRRTTTARGTDGECLG